jgi:hypothetical protein
MSLTTIKQLNLAVQSIRNILDRIESRFLTNEDALNLAIELELITSDEARDGSFITS